MYTSWLRFGGYSFVADCVKDTWLIEFALAPKGGEGYYALCYDLYASHKKKTAVYGILRVRVQRGANILSFDVVGEDFSKN